MIFTPFPSIVKRVHVPFSKYWQLRKGHRNCCDVNFGLLQWGALPTSQQQPGTFCSILVPRDADAISPLLWVLLLAGDAGYTDTAPVESAYDNGTRVSQQVYIDSGNEKMSFSTLCPLDCMVCLVLTMTMMMTVPVVWTRINHWSPSIMSHAPSPKSSKQGLCFQNCATRYPLCNFSLACLSCQLAKDMPDGMAGEPSNQGPSKHAFLTAETVRLKQMLLRRTW